MKRLLAALAIAALAVFFRLHALDAVPPGIFIDEAEDGIDAYDIATGRALPVYIEEPLVKARSREPMEHYVIAAVFRLRGVDVHSLRLGPALIGIATVLLFFWLCSRHMPPRTAFFAAAVLAVCRWHVTFSRIAMRAITTPLCVVIALLGLSFLVRRRSFGSAFVFGAALAFGFYSYPAYWITPVAIGLPGLLLLRGADAPLRAALPRLALASSLGFLLVAAPLIHFAATKPDYFFARAVETATPGAESEHAFTIRDNWQKVLFMLHLRGDPEPRHNIPKRPQLDPVSGVAFLLGLYWLLRTFRRDTAIKLAALSFWILFLLPSVVTEQAPHAMRALGAVPAVCLIVAFGLEAAGRFLRRLASMGPVPGSRVGARIGAAIVPCAALAAIVVWNHHDYFRVWANLPGVSESFSAPIPRFFEFYAGLTNDNDVYVGPYVLHSPNLRFLNLERRARFQPIEDLSPFFAATPAARDRVFVCDHALLNFLIQKLYPEVEEVGRYSIFGVSRGRIWRVRKEALRPAPTAEERAELEYAIGRMTADWEIQKRRW